MDTLLHSIKVHVEAAKLVRNHCKEALNLINWEWGVDVEEYIQCRGLVERTLKLIASVAKRRDIPDLKTGLLLANTQAVKQIMEEKTFHLRRLFLTSQNWQNCKEDPVPNWELFVEELYDAGVHLNLSGEICAGRPLFLTLDSCDRASVEQSGASDKEGQHGQEKTARNAQFTTTPAPSPISPSTTVNHLVNMPRENQQSADAHASGDGKAHLSVSRIMPKAASVEEADDDDSDFELIICDRKRGAGDNRTQESVVSPNVAGSSSEQGLSEAEPSRKSQLNEWLHCRRCGGLNVLWCEDVLDKPCVDLVGCMGVLGGFFYTHIFICKTHLLLLAVCCYLKTDRLEDIHDCLRTIWINGLSHINLMAFAKEHKDWFLSSSPINLGE